jgi:hypothetical protein
MAASAVIELLNEDEAEICLHFEIETVGFQRVYKLLALTHLSGLWRVVVGVLSVLRSRRVKSNRVRIKVWVVCLASRVQSLGKQRRILCLIMLHFASIWLQASSV